MSTNISVNKIGFKKSDDMQKMYNELIGKYSRLVHYMKKYQKLLVSMNRDTWYGGKNTDEMYAYMKDYYIYIVDIMGKLENNIMLLNKFKNTK